MVDDLGAVDGGVDRRELLQRVGRGLGEEAHEAQLDAVGLLEAFAQLLAHGHHLAQVHLVEGGEHGDGVLGLHHAFGDALADAGHRHALLGTGAAADLDVVDHVFLGHAATAAGAGDIGRVDVVAGGVGRGARGQFGLAAGLGRGLGGFGLRGRLVVGFRCVGLLFFLRRLGNGAFLDDRHDLLAVHRVAFLELELLEHAVDRRRHFEHDLVGLEVEQVLVATDGVTGLLVPGGDGGVGHGFRKDRDFDFDAHGQGPAGVEWGLIRRCGCWAR